MHINFRLAFSLKQILCAERQPRKPWLDWSKPSKQIWKIKTGVHPLDFKACLLEQSFGFRNRQCDGVPIKGNSTHHDPRPWIPRIVFPKRKPSARLQGSVNIINRFCPSVYWNVMKYAIAICQINLRRWTIFLRSYKWSIAHRIPHSGLNKRLLRHVDSNDSFWVEFFQRNSTLLPVPHPKSMTVSEANERPWISSRLFRNHLTRPVAK